MTKLEFAMIVLYNDFALYFYMNRIRGMASNIPYNWFMLNEYKRDHKGKEIKCNCNSVNRFYIQDPVKGFYDFTRSLWAPDPLLRLY